MLADTKMDTLIKLGLQVAGISQLMLCVASVAIPRKLQWSERTADLVPLMRQLFYTYAVYVLGSHFFFAGVSLLLADELLAGGRLGIAMLGIMAFWWTVRIVCQFFFFDRTGIPDTRFNRIAEAILIVLFFCLTTVYWGALIWVLIQ